MHGCVVLCLPLALCRPQQTHALCAQAVALPPFSFLGFLAWHAVNSLRKLRRAGVPTLAGQYLLLWAAAGLAAVNASLLMALAGQAVAGAAWTSVWLLTRAGKHRSATLCDHRARVATPCASQCLLLPLEHCRPSFQHTCVSHSQVQVCAMPWHAPPHCATPFHTTTRRACWCAGRDRAASFTAGWGQHRPYSSGRAGSNCGNAVSICDRGVVIWC